MTLAAAVIYWVIVALWLAILSRVCASYLSNPKAFGATKLLLIVVGIDTIRNIVENIFFGLYFGNLPLSAHCFRHRSRKGRHPYQSQLHVDIWLPA